MIEQPALAFETATVSGQGAVGPDYAMAWHDNGNGVGSVGESDSTNGCGMADALGQGAVRDGASAGDLAQSLPDLTLERRASCSDWNVVDGVQLAGEVAGDGVGNAFRITRRDFEAFRTVVKAELTFDDFSAVGKESDAQASMGINGDHQVADWSGDGRKREMQRAGHSGYRDTGYFAPVDLRIIKGLVWTTRFHNERS